MVTANNETEPAVLCGIQTRGVFGGISNFHAHVKSITKGYDNVSANNCENIFVCGLENNKRKPSEPKKKAKITYNAAITIKY